MQSEPFFLAVSVPPGVFSRQYQRRTNCGNKSGCQESFNDIGLKEEILAEKLHKSPEDRLSPSSY